MKLLKEFGMDAASIEEGGAASPNRPLAPTEESIFLFLILFFNLFS